MTRRFGVLDSKSIVSSCDEDILGGGRVLVISLDGPDILNIPIP